MNPLISTQIVARTILWTFLFSTEVLTKFLMDKGVPTFGYFQTVIVTSSAIFLLTCLLGDRGLAQDFRELSFYDFLAQLYGMACYLLKWSGEPYIVLSSSIFVLKFALLLWPITTADGKTLENWPTFGLLALLRKRKARKTASSSGIERPIASSTHDKIAYAFILAIFPLVYLARKSGIKMNLALWGGVALCLVALYFERFISYLENQQELAIANEKRLAVAEVLVLKNDELKIKNSELADINQALANTNSELATKNEQLAILNAKLAASDAENSAKNQQLAEKNIELEKANLQRAAMVADLANRNEILRNASHDLKHPVWWLGHCLEQLMAERENTRREELGRQFRNALDGLGGAIESTIQRAKIATNATHLHIEALPVDERADMLEMRFLMMASAKGISFATRIADFSIATDADIFMRILSNLIINAMQSTSQGGICITFRRSGKTCAVRVWDSGCGIEGMQGRDGNANFESFLLRIKRDSQAVQHDGGHGIGLLTVKQLCTEIGTSMALRSKVGVGTVFQFKVPIAEELPI